MYWVLLERKREESIGEVLDGERVWNQCMYAQRTKESRKARCKRNKKLPSQYTSHRAQVSTFLRTSFDPWFVACMPSPMYAFRGCVGFN